MHQNVLLSVVRDDERHALFLKRLLVKSRRERPLCCEHRRSLAGVELRAGLRGGLQHAQKRQLRLRLQFGQEVVRRIAGHNHAACPAGLERMQRRAHLRQRIFAAMQNCRRAVGNLRVGVDVDADVVIVAARLCE